MMRAELYLDSNNITTDQKNKAALCSTMSPETFALLQNLLTREVTDVTYEEVKAALRQHYEEKRNFLAARLDFFRTVQQEGQSITDFLAELRNKAKECYFEEQCCEKCQDNALRDRLVMDCRHTFIQQAILKEGDASRTNVLQCAKIAELLSKELCKMHAQTTDNTTGHNKQEVHATVSRLARSNAFEINNALNTLKGARLTVNLTGKARKSAIDVGRLLIIRETAHSSTPSATGMIAKDTYRLYAGRLGSQSEKRKWLNTESES